jgi:glyoxylase I family protein
MTFSHVLSVIPVADLDASAAWYERLLGAPPTNVPMPGILAEWRVTSNGWIQVTVDAERAGGALLNLAIDDLDGQIDALTVRGIELGEVQGVKKGVRLLPIVDPDGNTVTLIANFRETY